MSTIRIAILVTVLAAAAALASSDEVPTGGYYCGTLSFASDGKQVQLLVQFRNGKGVDNMILLDGGYYSPPTPGQYGMDPLANLADVTALRFDGKQLSGELKWQRPDKRVESLALSATVVDGLVKGKAGAAELTGWLRSDAQMAQVNAFAPGKDWTAWTGSAGDWTAADTDRGLVADPKDRRLVWFSEATFGGGRAGRRDFIHYISGYASPILGDGRLFVPHQVPTGELVDEAVVTELRKWMGDFKPTVDPVALAARERGPKHVARVEVQDVVIGIDAASGKTLWTTTLPAPSFMPAPYNKHADDNRTGCYADGKVFVLGRTFRLNCLDGATGKLLWETSVPKGHARWEKVRQEAVAAKRMVSLDDMRPASHYPPLFHADGVVFAVFPGDGLLAFEAASGKLLWSKAATSPAAVWPHDGRRDIVFMTAKGLTCVDPKTGTVAWEKAVEGSPAGSLELRLLGSHLICGGATRVKDKDGKSQSVPQTTACYLLEKDGPRKLWTNTDGEQFLLYPMHAIAARDGVAYIRYMLGASGQVKSKVVAVELATGKVLGRQDFMGTFIGMIEVSSGWVLVHDDGCHAGSEFSIYSERDLKPIGRFIPTHITDSSYDSPMAYPFVDGRLILRGRNRLYCYDLRQPGR